MTSCPSWIRPWRIGALLAVLLMTLISCGGGGGASYSLSVDPASVSFAAEQHGLSPAGQSIRASFKGDGIVVGYPVGVAQPSWLGASLTSSTSDSATVSLQILDTALSPGTHTTTLRFVTGKSDGTHLVTKDVPISFRVAQGVSATEQAFTFSATEGAAPAPQTLHLNSDMPPYSWRLDVEASGDGPKDWLSVSTSSGNASGAVAVQVNAASRSRGTYAANLVLRNGNGAVKATLPVTYTVNGVYDLVGAFQVDLSQASTAGALDVPMALRTRMAPGEGSAQAWQITSDQPWVSVSPSSGNLSSDSSLTVRLDPAQMGSLPNGAHVATLRVHLTSGAYSDLVVPFRVTLAFPHVAHVAPYATWTGRTSPVILRGSGFTPGPVEVRFGSEVVTGAAVSATEIRVTPPAFAEAGRVPVVIDNALGLGRSGSELVVLPEPAYSAHSESLPVLYGGMKMIHDPERQAVLILTSEGIHRMRFQNGAWTQDFFGLNKATGLALGLDGRDLFATAGGVGEDDQVLRVNPETFAVQDVKVAAGYYEDYSILAFFNDGRAFLFDSDQWMSALQYPDMTSVQAPSVHGAAVLVTRDHSRMLLNTTTSSGQDAYVWDAAAPSFAHLGTRSVDVRSWSISQDGSRCLNGRSLLDRDHQALGDVVTPELFVRHAVLSPDGRKAYTVTSNDGWGISGPFVLRQTDLTAATGPYPADGTPLNLPLSSEYPAHLLVSEDGSCLFLLVVNPSTGGTRFLAIPI